ncbi:MAG: hypothetical protein IPN79_15175 [Saprospiraceae bacterium]|nr:hypothetical protein [Saprospiraceae bacterium]
MKTFTVILIVIAFLVLIGGFATASGAPQEAVSVSLACFFAILARIAQSSAQHNDLLNKK